MKEEEFIRMKLKWGTELESSTTVLMESIITRFPIVLHRSSTIIWFFMKGMNYQ